MTNKPHNTKAQALIGQTAQKMIDGSLPYFAGVIQLEQLRHEVGAYENDPDFMPFLAILAEIDSLGLGRNLSFWKQTLNTKQRSEVEASIEWAKEISLTQCHSLAQRYTS